jgi:hypothetical protein
MPRLLVAISWLAASSAIAAPRRILLQPLRFTGNPAPAEEKLLQERVFDTAELMLSERGDELVHREDLVNELSGHPELKDCAQPRCLLALGDRFSAERVITITLARSGTAKKADWNVRVDQFLVATAHSAPPTELPCNSCSADELLGDLSHILDPLLMARPPDPVCTLTVQAKPGTPVQVDGTELGAAPFSHTVAAGHHDVSAGGQSSSLECGEGSQQQLSLQENIVTPPPPAPPAPRRRSPLLKIVGASLLVLGVAGVIGGAVDLARNGNGTCDKAPGQRRCPQVYDTFTAGAALTGVGAAGVVAGAVVLSLDALRGRPRAYVSVGRDFAYLSVGGEL